MGAPDADLEPLERTNLLFSQHAGAIPRGGTTSAGRTTFLTATNGAR